MLQPLQTPKCMALAGVAPTPFQSRSSTSVEENRLIQLLHTGLIMMYGINSAAGALAQSSSSTTSQHLLPGRCKLTSSLLAQPTNSKTTHETPTPRHKSRRISAEEIFGDEERRRGCGAGMMGRCNLLGGRSTDMQNQLQWIRVALPFYEEEAPNLFRFCRCHASAPYSGLCHVTSVWGLSHNSIEGIEDHPGAIYPIN